jgi:hypothetical protein
MNPFSARGAQRRSIATIAFACLFTLSLHGQSGSLPPARDLNATLAELTRIAGATDQDLEGLHLGGKTRWLTFWRRDSAHKEQIAAALRRNLQSAVPTLVRDTQASGGSISATFKLYNDLSVVCESMRSLVQQSAGGGKGEEVSLSNDLSDLNRVREELSGHIQQTAARLESMHPELVSAAGKPKKIIIDDDVPQKPRARKRKVNP